MSELSWLTGEETLIVPLGGAISELASDKALLVICDQNEQVWYDERNGKPTGSAASKIITPTGLAKKGKAVEKFAYELAFDRVYGRDLERYVSREMELGHLIEPIARRAWEEKHGIEVTQVGFVYRDAEKRIGCSPDGLFIENGRLGVWETKARQRSAMSQIMAEGNEHNISKDHYINLQFNMWVCGATIGTYVEFFESGVKPLMVEQEFIADEDLWDCFETAVPAFCDKIDVAEKCIREF